MFQNSTQSRREQLKDWILSDNQSTAHVCCNSKFLKSIHTVKGGLHVNANKGILKCDQQGTCQNVGDVWCHPDAITNILGFSLVTDLCHVTCNDECKDAFVVHKPSGEQVRFVNCGQGLHCMDPTLIGTTLVNVVREMRGNFTP